MTQVLDSVPIRVAPLPGEAIDSWLEAYARRLQCNVRELLALAAVPAPTRAAWASRPWTAGTSPGDFAAISVLTGVPVAQLDAMTWGRFNGTLVTLAPSARRHGPARWWPNLSGSRFCPDCLAETAGRWMLAWRLPWTFACTEHRRLLADLCDTCGRRPRANWVAHKSLCEPPDRCRTSSRGADHPAQRVASGSPMCGRPLSQAITRLLPADGLVVSAARRLEATIGDAATARTKHDLIGPLDDLHAVARSCLSAYARSTPDELPDVVHETLAELDIEPGQPIADPSAHFGPRDHQARTIAFAVTLASHALSTEHTCLDPQIAAWLARHEIPTSQFGNPDGMIKRWAGAGRGIQQAMLRTAGPRLGPVDRLRYRVDGPVPAAPTGQDGLSRASKVPGLFWTGWALRLNTGMHGGQCLPFRTALSTALVLIGSDAEIEKVYAALGRTAATSMGKSLAWMVADLKAEQARHDFLAALCHLAAGLDKHGSPIDYTRRRELFSTVELDIGLLREHFDHTGLRLPSDGMIRHYRLRAAEMLTGHHPPALTLGGPATRPCPGAQAVGSIRTYPMAQRSAEARPAIPAAGCRTRPLTCETARFTSVPTATEGIIDVAART